MKKIFAFVLILTFIPLLHGCNNEISPSKALKVLNQNSFMSFPLGTAESELDTSNFTKEDAEPGYRLYRDERTYVQVSGNPPSGNNISVTKFSTMNPRYNIFGIEVGSSFESAYTTIMDFGFNEPTVVTSKFMQARGGDILIDIYGNDEGVIIRIETYYKFYLDYLVLPTEKAE